MYYCIYLILFDKRIAKQRQNLEYFYYHIRKRNKIKVLHV